MPVGNTGREWSDGELNELGNMLLSCLSIEEIARLLSRDQREVRDKVAEDIDLAPHDGEGGSPSGAYSAAFLPSVYTFTPEHPLFPAFFSRSLRG